MALKKEIKVEEKEVVISMVTNCSCGSTSSIRKGITWYCRNCFDEMGPKRGEMSGPIRARLEQIKKLMGSRS